MGYHTQSDIPNYWAYAQNFVLQDHMFEPNASWSLPEHLFLVSEWSANCTQHNNPSSCTNALEHPRTSAADSARDSDARHATTTPIYAWTDLTYLLHGTTSPGATTSCAGTEPDCENDAAIELRAGEAERQRRPGIWNPLPYFDTVRERRPARQHPVGRRTSTRPRRRARCPRCRGSCRPVT